MRSFFLSIAAVTLLACTSVTAQPQVQNQGYTHKNLTVFLLEGNDQAKCDYITLEEAMKQGKITLHETGSVNELSIDNISDSYVYIMAGDIVRGGKQDRTLGEDVVLKPKVKKVPLRSFCVEQSRWRQRGNERVSQFSSSHNSLSDKNLKIATRAKKEQSAVWQEVSNFQQNTSENLNKNTRSSESATSLELTLEDKDLRLLGKEYTDVLNKAFEGKDNIVGFVFCINGKISTVEYFANSRLFEKLRGKLVESAANEAISQYKKDKNVGLVTAKEIESFIAKAKEGKAEIATTTESMTEEKRETKESIMFSTFEKELSGEHPVHVSIYSYQGTEAGNPNGQKINTNQLQLLRNSR